MKTYTVKSNCTRAARKAHPDGGFDVFKADNGEWAFRPRGSLDGAKTKVDGEFVERQLAKKAKHAEPDAPKKDVKAAAKLKTELDLHETFKLAYGHFNATLFDGRLPDCMILVHRKKNARGYFWAERWTNRDSGEGRHEIAMNPDSFGIRTTEDILSTLVHEMTHLEQRVFGKAPNNGYHDKAWVKLMDAVGLMPYDVTGPQPDIRDGVCIAPKKQTGTKVSHIIVPGGPFELSCATLLETGVDIRWTARTPSPRDTALAKKKRASKTKFTCPTCRQNAWAKPDAVLGCWTCGIEMEDEA